jgi:hypothetical protein
MLFSYVNFTFFFPSEGIDYKFDLSSSQWCGDGGLASSLTPTLTLALTLMVGSLKMNTTLEYSTRVVQEGDHRCKKSTLNDLAYLTPLRIPLMNPV